MSWGEEQQKEIETIRERKITVKLSDADCDRLARKCGEHGLTIGELIENFVGDLVGGTYSNGSDERDYADQWFERCWFGMFPEPTLLNHLLNLGYEPEHYLFWLKNVEKIKSDIEITKQSQVMNGKTLCTTSIMMILQAMSVCLVTIVLMNI